VVVFNVQGAAMGYDDFRVSVLMKWIAYKKHKKYGASVVKCNLIFAFYFL